MVGASSQMRSLQHICNLHCNYCVQLFGCFCMILPKQRERDEKEEEPSVDVRVFKAINLTLHLSLHTLIESAPHSKTYTKYVVDRWARAQFRFTHGTGAKNQFANEINFLYMFSRFDLICYSQWIFVYHVFSNTLFRIDIVFAPNMEIEHEHLSTNIVLAY